MAARPSPLPLLLLAAVAFGGAAAGPVPYPESSEPGALAAWLKAETRLKPDQVVVAGPDSLFAIEVRPNPPSVANGRSIRLRQEVVRPAFVAVLGGRSAALDLDVDCAGRRVMRQGFDVYAAPNLAGAAQKLGGDSHWTKAEAGTALEAVIDGACDPLAPRPFDALKPQLAAAAPSAIEAEPREAATAAGLRGAVGASPNLVAELGDYPSVEAAEAAWRDAAAQAPQMADRSPRLEMESVGATTSYRALIDGFSGRAEAEALCRTLVKAGKTCRVRG